ncbi:MAG: hypothetical protein AAGH92_05645 [Planctomycetota bacterium]
MHRRIDRAVAAAAAGSFVFLVPAGVASAAPTFGYAAGTGSNTSSVVIDFSESGGDAYLFEYSYDGQATGQDMLLALDAAGDLDVFTTQFSFGLGIDGFAFDGNSQDVGFDSVTGRNWSYWIAGGSQDVTDFSVDPPLTQRESVAFGNYEFASSGAGSRFLEDGSLDGWIVNASAFNQVGGAAVATNNLPALPEPALAGLLMLAGGLCARRRRVTGVKLRGAVAVAGLASVTGVASAGPFAGSVFSYDEGSNPAPGFTTPEVALGAPERFTGEGVFPGAVTPLNAAFGRDEIVSIGEGGQLTVEFDTPVVDDPANPFGIDLLVFGNTFYGLGSDGRISGAFEEPAVLEVSVDGVVFVEVSGIFGDTPFPTLGYSDLTNPFSSVPGQVETDFRLPVDPALDATGLTFGELVQAYNGSGGGTGIDLASLGLSEISFVRVSNPVGSGVTPEIDAFAAVPEPTVGLAGAAMAVWLQRRRGASA